jgi:hypothetical protein
VSELSEGTYSQGAYMKHSNPLITAIAASMMTWGVQADILTTDPQSNNWMGTAGNTSLAAGIDPFAFYKFDSSLGNLTNVFVQYDLTINNGLLGADNLGNTPVTGIGVLGGKISLTSDVSFLTPDFQNVFSPLEVTQNFTFNLDADPTYSIGGTGQDIQSFTGNELFASSGFKTLNPFVFNQFMGGANDTFNVDFDTDSVVIIEMQNAQGFFQAVNTEINMSIYYEYDGVATPPDGPLDVNGPVGILLTTGGLLAFFAGLTYRNRKAQKNKHTGDV